MPKKTSDQRDAKNPEMALTYFIPFAPPLTRLEIRIRPAEKGAIANVKAYGFKPRQEQESGFDDRPLPELLAEAVANVSATVYKRIWRNIVEVGGLRLGDYEGLAIRTDMPTCQVDLMWKGGKNSFGGYDLETAEPYKTVIKAIEELAKKVLKEVYDKVYKDKTE